jgi:hypothetical protein
MPSKNLEGIFYTLFLISVFTLRHLIISNKINHDG